MKSVFSVLLILISISISQNIYAYCGMSLTVYPNKEFIPKNSNIIIEGHGTFDYLIDMDDDIPIYLKSKDQQIRLIKTKVFQGSYFLFQMVFTLEKQLESFVTYELYIENLDGEFEDLIDILKRRNDDGVYETITWTTKDYIDTKPPHLLEQITHLDSEIIPYGCGPSVNTRFLVKVEDDSNVIVLTELREIGVSNCFVYPLLLYGESLWVGREMCYGAFEFTSKLKYEVRFKLFDINGNTDNTWTKWMSCNNPYDNY